MRIRPLLTAALASVLTATPVMAASANPAASLSLGSQARAGSAIEGDSELSAVGGGFGGVLAAIILVGVLTGIVIGVAQDDNPDSP
jgi:hypothetical protein